MSAEDLASIDREIAAMRLPGERADDPDVVVEEGMLRTMMRRDRLKELQGQ